jgi:uncharacterized Zn finger protein
MRHCHIDQLEINKDFSYLNVRQAHEIFGDMNHKLVHESWSYVKPIHVVIQVVSETHNSAVLLS